MYTLRCDVMRHVAHPIQQGQPAVPESLRKGDRLTVGLDDEVRRARDDLDRGLDPVIIGSLPAQGSVQRGDVLLVRLQHRRAKRERSADILCIAVRRRLRTEDPLDKALDALLIQLEELLDLEALQRDRLLFPGVLFGVFSLGSQSVK